MITWLPRWRTRLNPCRSRISQTASPEKGRSLGNLYLDLRHEHLRLESSRDFGRIRAFEEQCQSLNKVKACFFDRAALAGNVILGTQRDVTIALAFDDRSQTRGISHVPILSCAEWPSCPETGISESTQPAGVTRPRNGELTALPHPPPASPAEYDSGNPRPTCSQTARSNLLLRPRPSHNASPTL